MTDKGFVTFRGQCNGYLEIAGRGTERMGLGMRYEVHSNTGCFTLRFVAHNGGEPMGTFTHFTVREQGKYFNEASGYFAGVRLNKFSMPIFTPPPHPTQVYALANQFNLWETLAEWIAEQVKEEGFQMLVPELAKILATMVPKPVEAGNFKLVLEFPDFTLMKTQYQMEAANAHDPSVASLPELGEDEEEEFDA